MFLASMASSIGTGLMPELLTITTTSPGRTSNDIEDDLGVALGALDHSGLERAEAGQVDIEHRIERQESAGAVKDLLRHHVRVAAAEDVDDRRRPRCSRPSASPPPRCAVPGSAARRAVRSADRNIVRMPLSSYSLLTNLNSQYTLFSVDRSRIQRTGRPDYACNAATNRAVIAGGFVIAVPTTTNAAPRSIALPRLLPRPDPPFGKDRHRHSRASLLEEHEIGTLAASGCPACSRSSWCRPRRRRTRRHSARPRSCRTSASAAPPAAWIAATTCAATHRPDAAGWFHRARQDWRPPR